MDLNFKYINFLKGCEILSLDISISLKESNDVLNDIFNSSEKRGSSSNNIFVYFYRYIGFSDEKNYIEVLKTLNKNLKNLGSKYVKFMDSIPVILDTEYTNKVVNVLKALDKNIFNQGVERLEASGLLNFTNYKDLNFIAKKALKQILNLYYSNEISINLNIAINFIGKILLWCRDTLRTLFISNNKTIPKVVYFGNIKKHEIYFLILMSQCGYDVLYINSESDCDFDEIDKYNKYSKKIEFLNKKFIDIDPAFKDGQILTQFRTDKAMDTRIEREPSLKTILNKDTIDPFKNMLKPLAARTEFTQKPSLMIPTCFYIYQGVNGTDEESISTYKNELFNFSNNLKSTKNGYINFTSSIPINNNANISSKLQGLDSDLGFQKSHIEILIKRFVDAKILPVVREPLLNNAIINGFNKTCSYFLKIEENNNLSKTKNFFTKLVIWINEYFPNLYKNFDFKECPKILFYGNIKLHEVLLLIFFSFIGVDIIYINPDIEKNKIFSSFKDEDDLFTKINLKYSVNNFDFPNAIIPVRKSTENYKVQEEIQNVIYDDVNISMLRPWQFENKMVTPITLKSTYDEVKLLINEEAKFRPEFSFNNTSIYIPNFFVKIKGVHEEISDYWSDMKIILNSPNSRNVYFVNKLPFTRIDIGVNESYFSYLIENNKLNKNKLFIDRYYRFGYLKTALQNLIISKINYLMNSKHIFACENDFQFELKIIKTLLNMSPQVIKMLELFDFPSIVPKLVIYHNNKEMFSIYDAITIALLNSCGVDIVIFTPTNYNDIEPFIRESLYDTYQLPKVNFNLNFNSNAVYSQPKKTFFKNFFK